MLVVEDDAAIGTIIVGARRCQQWLYVGIRIRMRAVTGPYTGLPRSTLTRLWAKDTVFGGAEVCRSLSRGDGVLFSFFSCSTMRQVVSVSRIEGGLAR